MKHLFFSFCLALPLAAGAAPANWNNPGEPSAVGKLDPAVTARSIEILRKINALRARTSKLANDISSLTADATPETYKYLAAEIDAIRYALRQSAKELTAGAAGMDKLTVANRNEELANQHKAVDAFENQLLMKWYNRAY